MVLGAKHGLHARLRDIYVAGTHSCEESQVAAGISVSRKVRIAHPNIAPSVRSFFTASSTVLEQLADIVNPIFVDVR